MTSRDSDPPSHLAYRALADPTRRHLVRVLEDAQEPLDVRALAHHVGLHHNTVREHLELLVTAGMAERTTERRTSPGRPRVLYRAAPPGRPPPGSEGYRLLTRILAGLIADTTAEAAAVAEEAGRRWGRYLVDRPEPVHLPDPRELVETMVAALADLGFEPEEQTRENGLVLRLHDCPFREVARSHTGVVCSIHLGILRGMVDELGGSVTVDDLHPFVGPSLCVADISPAPAGRAGGSENDLSGHRRSTRLPTYPEHDSS